MVMENQRRDPHAWCELIQRHQVTLWNSVPALFDMLLTRCEGFADATPENLRAVMLSGDWIGLDLPPLSGLPATRTIYRDGRRHRGVYLV